MPEISRFFGIVIAMFYKEHMPPHFHAKYSWQWAAFSIEDLTLIEGELPRRAISLILEWAFQHRDALMVNWEKAQRREPLDKIEPLLIRRAIMRWVTEATYLGGYKLKVRFDNGEIKAVDLEPHLDGPIFEPLKDLDFFKSFSVSRDIDTVVWPNHADFSPDFLYEIGRNASDQNASPAARISRG